MLRSEDKIAVKIKELGPVEAEDMRQCRFRQQVHGDRQPKVLSRVVPQSCRREFGR
jgi:hypothetical protein